MARNKTLVVTVALLGALLLLGQAAGAAIPAEYQNDIDAGLAWLVQQQDGDTGAFGSSMRVQQTSFAVKKMLDRAHELGKDPFQDYPEAPDYYEYHLQLMKGIAFILSKVQVANPDQGSIWDSGDDQYPLGDTNPPPIVIETSAAILALTSTGTPDATGTLSDGTTATYLQIVEGAVDYLKLAQNSDRDGGWTRFFQDPWIPQSCWGPCEVIEDEDCLKGPLQSDQWNTGIATVALLSAEKEFGISMDEVRAGLHAWVLGGIQNDDDALPGFGGSYFLVQVSDEEGFIPDPPGILPTGYLLLEQKLANPPIDASRVQDAILYLEGEWGTDAIFNDYETLYAVMRGLDAWEIRELSGEMWFGALTGDIVDRKGPDPFWIDGFGEHPDGILPTEYALLLLEGWETGAVMTLDAEAVPAEVGLGEEVLCTVTITNTGESSIFGLTLTEVPGTFSLPAEPQAGDDLDGILEPGEAWTYTGSAPVYATMITTITATGEDLRGLPVTVSDEMTVTVTTSQENNPPVATGQSVTTNQGVPVGITLSATDPDPTDSLVFTIVAPAVHGTLSPLNSPDLTYTPSDGFFGTDSFTFQASDGTSFSNIATVTITVNEVKVNVAPVAESQAVNTNENTPRDIILTATDQNHDLLTYQVLSAPAHGTLSGTAPAISYQPALNWYGEDSFIFQASDGELTSNVATVTITVVHENQPPVVEPVAACLWPPNHKFSDVSVTGVTDPDGDLLTITITAIMSDEPPEGITGAGGKTHAPDATGIGGDTATLLRSERSGNNNGRVYLISFLADDGVGEPVEGTVTVCVPHDMSQNCFCTNDGAVYDATV